MCIVRSLEIDGAADAKVVAIAEGGTVHKRGGGSVDSAIVLGLETDVAADSSSF